MVPFGRIRTLQMNLPWIRTLLLQLARKVTGVFNSIKEALPTFEEDVKHQTVQQDEELDGNASSRHGPMSKSFLFPDFFANSTSTSPIISPSREQSEMPKFENPTETLGLSCCNIEFCSSNAEVNKLLIVQKNNCNLPQKKKQLIFLSPDFFFRNRNSKLRWIFWCNASIRAAVIRAKYLTSTRRRNVTRLWSENYAKFVLKVRSPNTVTQKLHKVRLWKQFSTELAL